MVRIQTMRYRIWLTVLIASLGLGLCATASAKPLKVYILAGQSNMEGHAKISTFDYIGEDPKTAPLLKEMIGPDGQPRVSENVWISNLTGIRGNNGHASGKLTAGYGARTNPAEIGEKIGPEFTFGLMMGRAYDGPILIIKTAWGGKSLHTDFRPPNAGPYRFNDAQLEKYKKQGKDLQAIKADKEAATGHYYKLMIDHVKQVLGDIEAVYPAYDADQGYELAGFVWFQGWNDMVDSGTYPERGQPGGYDLYSKLMAQFILDVREDLSTPKLPFVIGVMGVGGMGNEKQSSFREAMAAPADMRRFRGTVAAVPTAPYWDEKLAAIDAKRAKVSQMARMLRIKHKDHANKDGTMTPQQQRAYIDAYRAQIITPQEQAIWDRGASNAGYHYLGCGKTIAQIGEAFAKAMMNLEQ